MPKSWSLLLLCGLFLCASCLEPLEADDSGGSLYLVRYREQALGAQGLAVPERVAMLKAAALPGETVEEHVHTGSVLMRLTESRRRDLEAGGDLLLVPAGTKLVAVPPAGEAAGLTAGEVSDSWHMNLVRDLRDAWPVASRELDEVKVAFLDTGVDSGHPDLAGSLLGELAYNSTADGGAGLSKVEDSNGHGTHVAGVISGTLTGVSPGLDLIPVKFADQQGGATFSDFDRGLDYLMAAMDREGSPLHGRRLVINISYSTTPPETAENEVARDYFLGVFSSLEKRPVLFVFAGGNDDIDVGRQYVYPPCLEAPNLVSVAAVTSGGALADSFSNYGRGKMEVAAPGDAITTTSNGDGGYETVWGTSFGAPFVSGVAAWLWASNPDWESFQVRNVLMNLVSDPYWTRDRHLAPVTYTVPVLSGGAMNFMSLDGGQAFLNEAAGTAPRGLDVRVPPGDQQELPGSGDSDGGGGSWIAEAVGGGCRIGSFPWWLVFPAALALLRARR